VENLTVFPLFTFWVLAPAWLRKWYKSSKIWNGTVESGNNFKKNQNFAARILLGYLSQP